MQQEPTHELATSQLHGAVHVIAFASVVLVRKRDVCCIDGLQPPIRYRDAYNATGTSARLWALQTAVWHIRPIP